jgi:hypothetical protein
MDILAAGGGSGNNFNDVWNSTAAADDFGPIPPGNYVCRVESGELDTSRKGTPGYKLTFCVLEGPGGETQYAGRKLWHDCWLTPAALPQSKRDLVKLGIDTTEKLESPLPPGIRCQVQVALRKDDDGSEHNRVRRFDVVGIDAPPPNPFAPAEPKAEATEALDAPEGEGGAK